MNTNTHHFLLSHIQQARTCIHGIVSCLDVLCAEILDARRLYPLDFHFIHKTLFGPAFIFNVHDSEGSPVRVLCIDGAFESATYIDERRFDLVFDYYRGFDLLFQSIPQPQRILMIGGSGCAWPKHAVMHHPHVVVDVAEIDPAIAAIARAYFFVDEVEELHGPQADGRFNLIVHDGLSHLASTSHTYDVIINDAFAGSVHDGTFATPEALQRIAHRLTPTGLYMINVVVHSHDTDEYDVALETHTQLAKLTSLLHEIFTHVAVIACIDENFSGEGNYIVLASQRTNLSQAYPQALSYQDFNTAD